MKWKQYMRPGFHRFIPWSKKQIRKAVKTDKVRNSLISAMYYLDLLLVGEEYGKLNLAQKELIHRTKSSIDDANHRLDDLFGEMDLSLAALAINEQKKKGKE